MPWEVRLFVRSSLACFALAMLLGAGMVAARQLAGIAVPRSLVVAHTHLALTGGMLLMVMGVAFWMFPLNREAFPATKGRWRPILVHSIYALVVGGLALRTVVEPLQGERTGGLPGALLVLAALLQVAGTGLFVLAIGPRVRAVHTP